MLAIKPALALESGASGERKTRPRKAWRGEMKEMTFLAQHLWRMARNGGGAGGAAGAA
jgi:hypothetical protein